MQTSDSARGESVDAAGSGPLADRRILLVEDAPIDRRLMATLLTRSGAEVVLECNGQAAVDRVYPRRGGPEAFDAVLMDLMMSPVDGAEATETLRGRGFTAPILILTSSSDPADAARCRAAGCDRFVSKPVPYDALLNLLAECLSEGRRPTASPQEPRRDADDPNP